MTALDTNDVLELSADDYQKAYTEVAFLLDAFASTVDNIMGGNTAPIGRIAGRDTAKKLPVQISDPAIQNIVKLLSEQMQAGFEFSLDGNQLVFKKCIIGELCKIRKIEKGEAVCRLFHSYFDGLINGLLFRPVKSQITSVGEECQLQTDVQ